MDRKEFMFMVFTTVKLVIPLVLTLGGAYLAFSGIFQGTESGWLKAILGGQLYLAGVLMTK